MVMPTAISRKQYIIGTIIVLLAAIGLFGIIPRFGDFGSSLQTLRQATPVLVAAAAVASVMACVFSAYLYKTLAFKRLNVGDTLLVQLSGLFVNRVLPAGIGGLGLNFLYLRAHKHTAVQATTVVALNNSIGLMGHTLLALGMLALSPAALRSAQVPTQGLMVAGAIIIALVLAVLVASRFSWMQNTRRSVGKQLKLIGRFYARQPSKLVLSVLISFMLTLSNVVSLWLCCQALGVELSFLAVFVVFTFGIVIGTATPTPGGLGGVEAGLVGALVLQGVAAPLALAVALLYRLVSYWLGLFIGIVASLILQRRHLLKNA